MSAIGEDFRTYVIGTTSVSGLIGSRMHERVIPQDAAGDRIWYQRSALEEPLTLDGDGGVKRARFDLECISEDADAADDLADAVRSRLHGASGTIGNVTAQGIFVEDQDDDYIPKGINSDEGEHVVALDVLVIFTT